MWCCLSVPWRSRAKCGMRLCRQLLWPVFVAVFGVSLIAYLSASVVWKEKQDATCNAVLVRMPSAMHVSVGVCEGTMAAITLVRSGCVLLLHHDACVYVLL